MSARPRRKAARGEEGRGEVERDRPLEAREVERPDRQVLGRVDPRHGCADVDRAERVPRVGEEAVDLGLDGQVGPGDGRAAELLRQRLRSLLPAVVVDEDVRSLGSERARAGCADPARRAGDDDAVPCEPCFHGLGL